MLDAHLVESHVEEHMLAWFHELGYTTLFGPDIEPDTLVAERKNLGDVILRDRFMRVIARLNLKIPVEVFDEAAGLKMPDISILSEEFLAEVRELPQKNLAAELLRKLLNDELRVRAKKRLVQSRSFAELLDQTIHRYKNRAIETVEVIEELIKLAKELWEADRRGRDLGLNEAELAFYEALEVNDSAVKILGDDILKQIAHDLAIQIKENVTIDWTVKENVKAKMRVMVKRILIKYNYPPDKQPLAVKTILEQAEILCGEIDG
jgi:type I restriction enzyme R subunit